MTLRSGLSALGSGGRSFEEDTSMLYVLSGAHGLLILYIKLM